MNKSILIALLAFLNLIACNSDHKTNKSSKVTSNINYNPEVESLKYENLIAHLNKKNDTLYLVNFWATWCVPCVKELPYFINLSNELKQKPFKFVMVNLDKVSEIDSVLKPFLKNQNWNATHYLLDDNGRMNEWIPKFDSSWSGAIPATFLYKNGDKLRFAEGPLSEKELRNMVQTVLTQ